jgi:hypothetical protein
MRFSSKARHAMPRHRVAKVVAITGIAALAAGTATGVADADDEVLSAVSVDVVPGQSVDVYAGLDSSSNGQDWVGCNVDATHTATMSVTTTPNSKVTGISPNSLEIADCDDPDTANIFEGAQKVTLTAASDAPVGGSNSVMFNVASGTDSDPNGFKQTFAVQHGPNIDYVTTYSLYPGQAVLTVNYIAAAGNHAPVVTDVTATPTGPCTVDIDATFTDEDADDTHTATIDWNTADTNDTPEDVDESDSDVFGEPDGTTPGYVAGSHTYSANGSYDITVEVTDQEDASDSDYDTFVAKNAASDLLAPVNKDGSSTFKINSTIPLKITVKNCAGDDVSTLAPTVSLKMIANADGEEVNEAVTSLQPTNGKDMRWDGTSQYIYNLSTKNSQFSPTGGCLKTGEYEVTISDASFYAPSVAEFTLRK